MHPQAKTESVQISPPMVKSIPKSKWKANLLLVLGVILVIGLGIGTGWLLAGREKPTSQTIPGGETGTKEAGLADESTFKDSAEGILEEGGVDGEGTHHLVRPGGPSQNVYLTSTVIDLQTFVGKKVKVWGQTIAAQQAGWLMDVGKIRIVE